MKIKPSEREYVAKSVLSGKLTREIAEDLGRGVSTIERLIGRMRALGELPRTTRSLSWQRKLDDADDLSDLAMPTAEEIESDCRRFRLKKDNRIAVCHEGSVGYDPVFSGNYRIFRGQRFLV